MDNVTVTCDRCGKAVEGIHSPSEGGIPGGTGGYYTVEPPSHWVLYADPGEKIICDECMWKDARYISAYGERG